MSKIRKLKKEVEYLERAKEKYWKFFNVKIICSICNADTNLQWYNTHLKNKKCKIMQNLIFNKEELEEQIQLLKDKVYYIKYGDNELNLNDNSNITKEELDKMLEIKKDLNSDF